MSTNDTPKFEDLFGSVIVTDATVAQFERLNPLTLDVLYKRLLAKNPALAMFLRRRATALSADLVERSEQIRLALEVVALLDNQELINNLNSELGFPIAFKKAIGDDSDQPDQVLDTALPSEEVE